MVYRHSKVRIGTAIPIDKSLTTNFTAVFYSNLEREPLNFEIGFKGHRIIIVLIIKMEL